MKIFTGRTGLNYSSPHHPVNYLADWKLMARHFYDAFNEASGDFLYIKRLEFMEEGEKLPVG